MKVIANRILVIVIGVPLIALLWLVADGTRPYLRIPQGTKEPVVVDIPRGVRTVDIARQLEQAGVIRSHWTFLGLHLLRWHNSLKAGEYDFAQPASTLAVLNKIIRGDVSYEVLTVPEGDNRFDIANLVAAQGFSTRDEFLRATEDPQPIADLDPDARDLEGYLFPDSYRLPRHARPAEIVRDMVERFRQVAATVRPQVANPSDGAADTDAAVGDSRAASPADKTSVDKNPASGERSLREIVTVASMVEKETSLSSERPVIAGIFYNRLKRDLLLQCDPTVVYAALIANRFTGKIRKEDLTFDSPYNTYAQKGLPEGPIANPGKAALLAALHPESTDYLYFVANDEGGHYFSKTLDEHNANVEKYREGHAARLSAAKDASAAGALASAAAPASSSASARPDNATANAAAANDTADTADPKPNGVQQKPSMQKPSTAVAKSNPKP